MAVCWCLRYGLSLQDVEELLAESRVEVDHVNLYGRVQGMAPATGGSSMNVCEGRRPVAHLRCPVPEGVRSADHRR